MGQVARRCVVMGFCALVLAAPSRGQEAGTPKVEVHPWPRIAIFEVVRVVAVEADGTIRLEPIPNPAFPSEMPMQGTEGHYLLIPLVPPGAIPGGRPRPDVNLVRAEVIEIGEGNSLTAKSGPEAAGVLKAGEEVALVRPVRMTTAQIRALPAVIPVVKEGDVKVPGQVAQVVRLGRSVNNLKRIGLALHNFHAVNNHFPPAVVFGPDGKRWHSWRVLILPYLEQTAIFNRYDFTQPWDSPKNRALIAEMPAVYRDPLDGEMTGSDTHYAALVGEKALFSSKGSTIKIVGGTASEDLYKGRGMFEVTDGTSNTIAVVPVDPSRKIPWTRPEDITVGADFPGVGKPGGIFAPSRVDGVGLAPVLIADGSVRTLFETNDPAMVRAMATINGGEIIDTSKLAAPAGYRFPGPGREPTLYLIRDGRKVFAMIE